MELLLELLGVVYRDDVATGDLEDAISGICLAEDGWEFGEENSFASASAGEEGFLAVISRVGADDDRDAGVTAADAEVGVLYHDREGLAGSVPEL